jgi:Domain of unknown function (DUF4340)
MKIHGLISAVLVLGILGGLLYWSEHHKPVEGDTKVSADTPPTILKFDQANITKLEIKKKGAEPITLTKADSGNWTIFQPKQLGADQGTVSGILSTVSSLNSDRLVEDKAADLKVYGFDQPGLEVDITGKDSKTHKLLIGDDTPAGSAVYAMLAGDPRVFTMSSYKKTSVDKSLNDLRDKRLLTVNSDKIGRLELMRKGEDIEFGRNKDDWQILKPKPLRADTFQVSELVRKLTDARMNLGGATDNNKEAASAFAHGVPVATAKLTDTSATQQLEVRKNKDTYYAKSSAVEGEYKVGSDLGQAMDKGLDDFRNKKLFDFGYTDPNKVELHIGPKASFLTRSGEDWWGPGGKKVDAASAQSVISKLRDLSASKFVDTGFAKPEVEAMVTLDDGKRVEKILISKSGSFYVGKRENEPSLYQLETSAVDDLKKAADEIKPAATK